MCDYLTNSRQYKQPEAFAIYLSKFCKQIKSCQEILEGIKQTKDLHLFDFDIQNLSDEVCKDEKLTWCIQ